jgi:tetratricopeptide (TPR) repeat protein
MKRRSVLILFVSALILVLFQGCSRPFIENQLYFGAEAARKDLWDEAIFRWRKVLISDPQSAAAHNNLAVAYEKKGLWDKAREEYEIALTLSPDNKYIKSNFQNFQDYHNLTKKDRKNDKN